MTIHMNRNKGFSLIELMIVIAIIGILVAVALPQFASMTEDAKKTKAKQDCDTIAQSIQKYNSLEGTQIEELMDLKGKYLTNIDTLRDPWGNAYQIDTYGGFVYSKGADGQDNKNDSADKKNNDNIKVSYIGALSLVKASLEVNPSGNSNPAEAFDVLHLFFNKRVKLEKDLNLITDSAVTAPSANAMQSRSMDADTDGGTSLTKALRWCEGTKNKYVDPANFFKTYDIDGVASDMTSAPCTPAEANTETGAPLYNGTADAGQMYYSEDSREIIIGLPAGTSGSIIPGTHFINLTGNRKNAATASQPEDRNPLFKEFDGKTGGEMSGTPIKIEVND